MAHSYQAHAQSHAGRITRDELDAVLGNPANALDAEVRRTLAWLRFLDEHIAELGQGIIWGISETELRATGVKQRDLPALLAHLRGRTHPAIELRQRESKHLLKLLSVVFAHDVPDQQRAAAVAQREALERHLDSTQRALDSVIRALGRDPHDPEVRALVRQALVAAAIVPSGGA